MTQVNTPLGFHEGSPPVWGFEGTGEEARQVKGDQQVFYVDSGHANANDNNTGLDPDYPLATIQELIDRSTGASTNATGVLANYDVIYVSGTVSEDVQTGDYTVMPSYVSLIGAGPTRYSPQWEGDDAATPSLDLRCVGWRVEGFRFTGKTGAACVELRHTDTGANDIAIRTHIVDCYFDGLTTGLYGISTRGCYDVWIVDCTLSLWNNAGNTSTAINLTSSPLAIPYRQHIVNCHVYDNDNGVVCPMNGSFVRNSSFQKNGYAYASAQVLNTSVVGNPGDDNMIFGNFFEGDFSLAGGYRFGTNDFPMGNFSDDVAEAEVDATGLVVAIPT